MKTILIGFAAGAVCSAAIVILATRDTGDQQSQQADAKEKARPASTRSQARKPSRISSSEPSSSRTSGARSAKRKTQAEDKSPRIVDGSNEETKRRQNEFMEKWTAARKKRQEKRIAAKLKSLVKTLNLSDEQAEKVEALLKKKSDTSLEGSIGRVLNLTDLGNGQGMGGIIDPSQLQKAREEADEFNFEDEMREVLDGDQLASYDQHLEKRRVNHVEATANGQLAKLQKTLPDLSDDQKDRVYEEFARIAREDVDAHGVPDNGRRNFDFRRMNRRAAAEREVLKNILTPEQQELYKNSNNSGNRIIRVE